jgi:agmatinase
VFAEKNVVGFDIVELCPNGNSKPSEFAAAKLYYKMLSYKFEQEDAGEEYEVSGLQEKSKKINQEEDDYND